MKRIIQILFITVIALAGSYLQEAKASHMMGSDIVYRCLGNGQYEIVVRVYRDCNGIQISQSPIVMKCGSTTLNITNQTKVSARDITGIDARCPIQSRCSGSYQYGVEEHIWKATVDLSSYTNCCEWTMSWEQSARNGNITTGMANQNFHTYAQLNKCITPCNSSPDFTNPPVAIICHNQDFAFNNGALDTNDTGDSLSYSLVAGLQYENQLVTYGSGFSPTRPLTFWGFPNNNLPWPLGFHLDPLTGDLLFRPTKQNEVGIVVIEVKEWRMVNGQMEVVGVTRRDMQVIIVPCPNNKTPKINPNVGTHPVSGTACANSEICLDIVTEDDDATDTIRLSWNKGIPGAVFTHNNGTTKTPTGKVCWTPTDAHVSNIPYTFTITARDDACPLAGQTVRAFSIYVRETPKANRNIDVLNCGKVALNYTPVKQYSGLFSSWLIRDSLNKAVYSSTNKQFDTAFLQPGIHRVYLNLRTPTPCVFEYVDSIIIPEFVQVDIPSDTVSCEGSLINVISTTKNGNAPYVYEWTQLTDSTPNLMGTSEDLIITPDTHYKYVVQVKDNNGCFNWDTINVDWALKPPVSLGPDQRVCEGVESILDGGNDTTQLTYLWSTSDTTREITVKDSNSYWVRVKDNVGCINSDTMVYRVNIVRPEAGFNRNICEADTVTLSASGSDTYQWYNATGFTPSPLPTPLHIGPNYHFTVNQTTKYILRGTKTEGGVSCSNFDSVTVTMNPLPAIDLYPGGPYCPDLANVSLFSLISPPTLTSGTWRSDIKPALVSGNNFHPNLAGEKTNNPIIYSVTDNKGCYNEKSISLAVTELPKVQLSDSIVVCADVVEVVLNDYRQFPIQTVGAVSDWASLNNNNVINSKLDKSNINNVKLRVNNTIPVGVYPITFTYTQPTTGCINKDTIQLRIKEVPTTDAGSLDPVCWNTPPLDLTSKAKPSPAGGTWSSTYPLNGSNFRPADIGTSEQYKNTNVTFTYSFTKEGCTKTDDVTMQVRQIPQVDFTAADFCMSEGDVDLNTLSSAIPGVGTRLWSGPGVNGNVFSTTDAGGGLHQITYTHTLATGCSNSDADFIMVELEPDVVLNSPENACEDVPFQIDATIQNATGMQWSIVQGDGYFDGNVTTTPNTSTTYYPGPQDVLNKGFTLRAVTSGSVVCPDADKTISPGIFPFPTADIITDKFNGCAPLEINLDAETNAEQGLYITWDYGNGEKGIGSDELRKVAHKYNVPGTYSVNLTIESSDDKGNCEVKADPIEITVFATPNAAIDANKWKTTTAAPGVQFYDRSTIHSLGTIEKWEWSFGDADNSTSDLQNPFFEYPVAGAQDTGLFYVSLRVTTPLDQGGCWDTTGRFLKLDPDITVFIPNAFTPNGYGEKKNNRFFVIADGFETFNITIFNRWGEEMYYSTDINDGWDGKYKGLEAQQDVYVYVVRVTSAAGKPYEYYGTITLLR